VIRQSNNRSSKTDGATLDTVSTFGDSTNNPMVESITKISSSDSVQRALDTKFNHQKRVSCKALNLLMSWVAILSPPVAESPE
jgi:hypothetical protein